MVKLTAWGRTIYQESRPVPQGGHVTVWAYREGSTWATQVERCSPATAKTRKEAMDTAYRLYCEGWC